MISLMSSRRLLAWSDAGETLYKPGEVRVPANRHHDGDGGSSVPKRVRPRCPVRDEHIHFLLNKLPCKVREAVITAFGPPELQSDILALDVAMVLKTSPQPLQLPSIALSRSRPTRRRTCRPW